jgi:hypothetical protein
LLLFGVTEITGELTTKEPISVVIAPEATTDAVPTVAVDGTVKVPVKVPLTDVPVTTIVGVTTPAGVNVVVTTSDVEKPVPTTCTLVPFGPLPGVTDRAGPWASERRALV